MHLSYMSYLITSNYLSNYLSYYEIGFGVINYSNNSEIKF